MGGLGGGGVDGGMLGDGTLSGLETAARDAMQRVLANPDVQNAAESIRAGAMKVRVSRFAHIYILIVSSIAFRLLGSDVRALIEHHYF